ncbi:MAG: 3-hydroxybutyryl-CoA dehydrogenase [Candidatus Kapabacteria bacterium]|nr:3-hydroxybutyryl-CoA dehydrogenase [Candidatus Kapabacteria bacterium]
MAKVIKYRKQKPSITLLIGAPRSVAEVAQILESKGEQFYILDRSIEDFELQEMEEDMTRMMTEMMGLPSPKSQNENDIHPLYEPYANRVIFGIDDIDEGVDISCILDLSILTAMMKIDAIHAFAEEFPSALVLSSTLCCTATDLNAMLPLASQVVGFAGLPGWTSRTTIEIAPSLRTRDITHKRAVEYFANLGFATEIVEDRVALVAPRILAMLINEAAFAVMENVATPQDIDNAMKLGVNYPQGLLEWADKIGIDIVLMILDSLYDEYKQERYRPCVLLRQYMRAGWLGQETGRGFYNYMPTN